MKLPPDIEFHEDIRLLIYRPKGLINEAEINRVIGVIEGIEAGSQQPFNRFSDTSETHEVELNFHYVIQASLHRRLAQAGRAPVKSAILATDSTHCSLRPVACLTDSRFFDQSSGVPRSQRSRAMARCPARTAGGEATLHEPRWVKQWHEYV